MKKRKLTPKQAKFIDAYVVGGNATKAAELAGYAPNSAKVTGARLLTNANISKIIKEHRQKASDKADVSLEWWVKRVKALAIKAGKDSDQIKALDLLGKHLGAYEKDNKFSLDTDKIPDTQIEAIASILITKIK